MSSSHSRTPPNKPLQRPSAELPKRANLTDFRELVRAALQASVATDGREPIFWSNSPGSVANEVEARRFHAKRPASTVLLEGTPAGQALRELLARIEPSAEQADVAWGLLSHRFAMAFRGNAHAFVAGSRAGRIFRSVETREILEGGPHKSITFHETAASGMASPQTLDELAADEGDFFVTHDPDEQLVVMEEAERARGRG